MVWLILIVAVAVPEIEFSGVVADPGKSSYRVGDEVLGVIPPNIFTSSKGCMAEYVLAKVRLRFSLYPVGYSRKCSQSISF